MAVAGRKKFLVRALLATLVPLVLLEAALQVAAWIVATRAGRDEPTTPNSLERTVLCVGDSYTWGIGATDEQHSYPSRLEADLNASTKQTWSVQNGGWPGSNSADVLQKLPAQLDQFHPRFVCVLVGINDSWSHPKLEVAAPPHPAASTTASAPATSRFHWEWRTLRLLKIAFGGAKPDEHRTSAPEVPPTETAPPFVGVWMTDGVVFRFDRAGRFFFKGQERRWSSDRDVIHVDAPDGSHLELHWKIDGEKLRLSSQAPPQELLLVPAQPWPTSLAAMARPRSTASDEAQQALASGDDARAADRFEAALRESPLHPILELGLVRALVKLGRAADAEKRFAELRAELAKSPSKALAEACVRARGTITPGRPTVELARELATAFPTSVEIWRALATEADAIGDIATARAAIDRALAMTPDEDPIRKADLHHWRDSILRHEDPNESLKSVWLGYRLDGDRDHTLGELRVIAGLHPPHWIADAIGQLALDPASAAVFATLADEAARGDASVPGVLESHLRQTIELCRTHGALVLLLNYPTCDPMQEAVLSRLAAGDAAPAAETFVRVDVTGEFERLLATRQRSELFVADGHCNDAGYEVVARVVREALLQ